MRLLQQYRTGRKSATCVLKLPFLKLSVCAGFSCLFVVRFVVVHDLQD